MDAATLRRALYDFFKFNPKDFRVQASGTGYLVGINKQQQPGWFYTTDISAYGSIGGGDTAEHRFPCDGVPDNSPAVVNSPVVSPFLGIIRVSVFNSQVIVLWKNFDTVSHTFQNEPGYEDTRLAISIPVFAR